MSILFTGIDRSVLAGAGIITVVIAFLGRNLIQDLMEF